MARKGSPLAVARTNTQLLKHLHCAELGSKSERYQFQAAGCCACGVGAASNVNA